MDEFTIRERYTLGLEQLDNTFQEFDVVYLWLSKENENFHVYTLHPKLNCVEAVWELSQELVDLLPKLINFVKSIERK